MSTQPENELSTQKPAESKNWIFPLSPLWDSATCFYCSDRAAHERKLYSIQFNHDETDCWIHLDCLKRAIAEVEQRDSPAQHESPSEPAAPSTPVAPPTLQDFLERTGKELAKRTNLLDSALSEIRHIAEAELDARTIDLNDPDAARDFGCGTDEGTRGADTPLDRQSHPVAPPIEAGEWLRIHQREFFNGDVQVFDTKGRLVVMPYLDEAAMLTAYYAACRSKERELCAKIAADFGVHGSSRNHPDCCNKIAVLIRQQEEK